MDQRLCRHLHLPLQSGSSKVLREMARPYTADEFASLVEHLYDRIPALSLSTDIIYIKKDKEGVAEITVPANCTNLFFVVMGAPTEHWSHPWTSGKASTDWSQNDEQWPYKVKFENANPK